MKKLKPFHFGIDCNGGADVQKAKRHNVRFCCRYHSTDGYPRNLTRDEALEWTEAGIKLVSVYENADRQEPLKGYVAGVKAAKVARKQQRECGGSGMPIYFAVDFVARPSNFDRIFDYFEGTRSVIGIDRLGVYGTLFTVKTLLDMQAVKFAWQTALFEKHTGEEPWDPRAQLRQFENTDLSGSENFGVKDADWIPEEGRYLAYDHAVYPSYGGWLAVP